LPFSRPFSSHHDHDKVAFFFVILSALPSRITMPHDDDDEEETLTKERNENAKEETNNETKNKANDDETDDDDDEHESATPWITATADPASTTMDVESMEVEEEDSYINQQQQQVTENDDPHDLVSRYVVNQLLYFEEALDEVKNGTKRSCWLWFILPTPPFMIDGVEKGSSMNRHFALRTDEQCIAYLQYEREGGVRWLRHNYLTMLSAIEGQLHNNTSMSLTRLLGRMDDKKAISSFRLFERVGGIMGDDELCAACNRVLRLCDKDVTREI
jgi:uncharacterized protein (DUF1810 family)